MECKIKYVASNSKNTLLMRKIVSLVKKKKISYVTMIKNKCIRVFNTVSYLSLYLYWLCDYIALFKKNY